ncbi:MAG: hypothetical protein NXH90_18295 [Flavobacteriaceae bacterium]|nr:hypothetical protein [Flavobacteriaceae bacterium]
MKRNHLQRTLILSTFLRIRKWYLLALSAIAITTIVAQILILGTLFIFSPLSIQIKETIQRFVKGRLQLKQDAQEIKKIFQKKETVDCSSNYVLARGPG